MVIRVLLLASLLIVCPLSNVLAQTAEKNSAERLREGFGEAEAKVPPVEKVSPKTLMSLGMAVQSAREKQPTERRAESIRLKLAETEISGIRISDGPPDPWSSKHNHFQVNTVTVYAAAIEPGLVLLRTTGVVTTNPAETIDSSGRPDLIPVLIQFNKDGRYETSMGRVRWGNEQTNPKLLFEIVGERIKDAEMAMLVFIRPDRSWAMYRDATSGKPLDQLLTIKIDEQSLIEEEKKRISLKEAEVIRLQQAEDALRQEAEAQAAKERAAEAAKAQAERERLATIEDAKFRSWKSADGKKSTAAKIISYSNGAVTLENRAGKRIRVEMQKLSDEDRTFVDQWRKQKK